MIEMTYGSVDAYGYAAIKLRFGEPHNPPRESRYVGRCKSCGTGRQLVGVLCTGERTAPSDRVYVDQVVVTATGAVHRCGAGGTDPTVAHVRCGDHWCKVERVRDAHKSGRGKPRHECNAKCTASTGPSCECKCKGANHGASL